MKRGKQIRWNILASNYFWKDKGLWWIRDFRLPPWSSWELLSSGLLLAKWW